MANDPRTERSHRIAHPARPLGHEPLLTLARNLQAAATDRDPARLDDAARRFSAALDRHLRAEASQLNRMAPAQARILKKGQDRISALASSLVDDARWDCAALSGDCQARAGELVALLSIQARDEHHHAMDRHAA